MGLSPWRCPVQPVAREFSQLPCGTDSRHWPRTRAVTLCGLRHAFPQGRKPPRGTEDSALMEGLSQEGGLRGPPGGSTSGHDCAPSPAPPSMLPGAPCCPTVITSSPVDSRSLSHPVLYLLWHFPYCTLGHRNTLYDQTEVSFHCQSLFPTLVHSVHCRRDLGPPRGADRCQ